MRGDQPAWGSLRRVIETLAFAIDVGGEPDRFLGRGQVVEPVIYQPPEPVQYAQFRIGDVLMIAPILTDEVIVLRLNGRLIILLIRPGPGEENLQVRGPIDDRMIEKFRTVIDAMPMSA